MRNSVVDVLRSTRSSTDEGGGPARPATGGHWWVALRLVVLSRLVYLVVGYLAASFLATSEGSSSVGVLEMWTRWDARHFLEVAEFGYIDSRSDPHATAFFPAFPLLIRALTALGLAPAFAGMLISAGATVVAVAFLHRLAEEELGSQAARRACLYLLFFPTAVFLVAPYSEALFLAGAISAFYYARRARWLPAGACAALAMGARAAGIFLVVGLIVDFVRRRRFDRAAILPAFGGLGLALLPLVAYAAYLAQIEGDPLYFFTDQRLGWGRTLSGPLEALRATWGATRVDAGQGSLTNFVVGWRVEIVAVALGVGVVAWALAKREWGYAAFMGSLLAALMTSSIYLSVPRMLLTMFPVVLFLAGWTGKDQRRHESVLLALAGIAMLGTVAFTRGAWFY